jgi:hypothetical protein
MERENWKNWHQILTEACSENNCSSTERRNPVKKRSILMVRRQKITAMKFSWRTPNCPVLKTPLRV